MTRFTVVLTGSAAIWLALIVFCETGVPRTPVVVLRVVPMTGDASSGTSMTAPVETSTVVTALPSGVVARSS